MVKLAPTAAQHAALLATMEWFNAACDFIAKMAFEHHTANKIRLQQMLYSDIRRTFDLPSQMTVRAIAKTCEAYKRDKSIQPTFRPYGAIVYDQRVLSWKGIHRVSVLTLDGRQLIPVIMGEYQAARLDRIRGQVDLIYRDGMFYLAVVVDVLEPPMDMRKWTCPECGKTHDRDVNAAQDILYFSRRAGGVSLWRGRKTRA